MQSIRTLTVYLGSSGRVRTPFKDSATALGRMIGKQDWRLVYGGMDAGLMGLLAASALDSGAHVTGIIPRRLLEIERAMAGLSAKIVVEDLWDRKKRMFAQADALIALPGGFGTVDESLEVLYWAHAGLHNKPLVLVNIEGYWDELVAYLQTLPDFDPRFLLSIDKIEAVIPALKNYQPPPCPGAAERYPHFEDEITRATRDPIVIDIPSVENSYYAACALGLKQLHRHRRPIGFLNRSGAFDRLLAWIARAAQERFITQDCLKLFTAAAEDAALRAALSRQDYVEIDLHGNKWSQQGGGSDIGSA